MSRSLPVVSLLAALVLSPLLTAQEQEQWTYLFDEEAKLEEFYLDFIEETDPEEVFEFTDERGLLITGKDKPEGYLQTLDEYSAYELAFDWRWPDEEAGKGGIILHSSTFPYMGIWPEGMVVDLDHEKVGDIRLYGADLEVPEERMSTRSSERDLREKMEDEEKEPEHWNEMRILVTRDAIKVYLNDELVNEGTNPSLDTGFLTFQAEEANIEFRDVRIREIDEEEAE